LEQREAASLPFRGLAKNGSQTGSEIHWQARPGQFIQKVKLRGI
jgi:hypothetical protein